MARPPTPQAMRMLIGQVRAVIPAGLTAEQICGDDCQGCSLKLLNFLEAELELWEGRLDGGEVPTLSDVSKLARTARQVCTVLERNGVLSGAGD